MLVSLVNGVLVNGVLVNGVLAELWKIFVV